MKLELTEEQRKFLIVSLWSHKLGLEAELGQPSPYDKEEYKSFAKRISKILKREVTVVEEGDDIELNQMLVEINDLFILLGHDPDSEPNPSDFD